MMSTINSNRFWYYFDRLIMQLTSYHSFCEIQKIIGRPSLHYRFRSKHGYNLNLNNPQSFNEKLVYSMLFLRDSRLIKISDKLSVRSYILNKAPECNLVPMLGVFDPHAIPFDDLPDQFILKTNFQSGTNWIVNGRPLEKEKKTIARYYQNQMRKKYKYYKFEWWLQHIPRRLYSEALLIDDNDRMPKDYKFHMFNGHLVAIQVYNEVNRKKNGHGEGTCTLFDNNYKRLDVSWGRPSDDSGRLPDNVEEMRRIAEKLSKEFGYMRVDLYDFDNKVYFAELTPSPMAGFGKITPVEYDYYLGSMWKLVRD